MNTQTQFTHEAIKSLIRTRTTEQIIIDAKIARQNQLDEIQRMVCALMVDVLYERLPEVEADQIFEEIYN